MSTTDDLKNAFGGESQASRKYIAFSEKAEEEGYKGVAKLFRAAAASETIHARLHLKHLGEIKSTKENVQDAFGGETYEVETMYPEMIKNAEAEGNEDAKWGFESALSAEKVHNKLYREAFEDLSSFDRDLFVCNHCGFTTEGEAPEKCPICGWPKKQFIEIK